MAQPNGNHVDDEGIDFSDIEAKYQVPYENGFDTVLVVDNLPIVDAAKKDRLLQVIRKNFSKKGPTPKEDGLFMPWDDAKNKSKGYLFVEFESADEANYAMDAMQGVALDKEHKLVVNKFTDIEKFANMDETYVEPELEEFKPREHLRAWLADPQGRDQYVTYRNDDVSIFWHSKNPELVEQRKAWTELYVSWSPKGTYLASIHRKGVRLWGGPSWTGLIRLIHPVVKLIDFSPCETYIVTWSPEPIASVEGAPPGVQFTKDDEGNHIAVWDAKTGNLLRTFPYIQTTTGGEAEGTQKKQMLWPALKWSGDDKYVARVTPGQQISVYELPSMGLLDKKSIKVEGVVDFEWCPIGEKDQDEETEGKGKKAKKAKEGMLAYWTPEVGNQPARVSLMAIPSRTIHRSKNLFNVTDCKLYWQNQGDFLCVKVDRHTKTKKSTFCNLELFRVREKDFPVEVLEIKDTVTEFAWEPRGERFAIVSTNDPNLGNPAPGITVKTDVSFYQLEKSKGDFKLLRTLPNRTSNTIRWSPRGHHVVLATVGSTGKFDLEFWDMDFNLDDRKEGQATQKEVEWGSGMQLLSPANTEHYGVTDIEWDPSGRYVATGASAWRHTIDNGFVIWDFKGQEVHRQLQDKFKQFAWRPRPRTLLTKEQQRQIRRNLREFSRVFDEEDAAEESSASKELVAHRKRLADEWNAWRLKVRRELEDGKGAVHRRGEQGPKEEVEEWIEEVIETIEEVIE
ncbi:hypothetical protein BOTBODRAFT_152536 [Botryobasidium botryosum FD-172 SS1]|uniref:Eukaryotic translation initiation factor 3 subunit B n=1 Tax=Botryobasidium botryosum (strain FD-172 SS1) TaxID=930990 RepID=A0A067MWF9_BOTB1|nr:hypothetical protein BOTBODRAFT_152536 [Botryobasidium botryosum FD-172 SS1]